MLSPSDEASITILLLRACGIHASINNNVITATVNGNVVTDIKLNSISHITNSRYGIQSVDITSSISYKTIQSGRGKSTFPLSSTNSKKSDCGCGK